MQAPNPIESALARLMPPALSEVGQRSIEAMLDELAATTPQASTPLTHRPWWDRRFTLPVGIAAAHARHQQHQAQRAAKIGNRKPIAAAKERCRPERNA